MSIVWAECAVDGQRRIGKFLLRGVAAEHLIERDAPGAKDVRAAAPRPTRFCKCAAEDDVSCWSVCQLALHIRRAKPCLVDLMPAACSPDRVDVVPAVELLFNEIQCECENTSIYISLIM